MSLPTISQGVQIVLPLLILCIGMKITSGHLSLVSYEKESDLLDVISVGLFRVTNAGVTENLEPTLLKDHLLTTLNQRRSLRS